MAARQERVQDHLPACHPRAIRTWLGRFLADNHGQRRTRIELGGFAALQVTIAADLALGAGDRSTRALIHRIRDGVMPPAGHPGL